MAIYKTKNDKASDEIKRLSKELRWTRKKLFWEYFRKLNDAIWSMIYGFRHIGIRADGENDYATRKAAAYYKRMISTSSGSKSLVWEEFLQRFEDKYRARVYDREIIFLLTYIEQDLKPDFLKAKEVALPKRQYNEAKPSDELAVAEKNYAMKLSYLELLEWIDTRLARKFKVDP
ncbi:MAG: hypothetical protein A3J63_00445 [Candidatus Moranbacteria bacterium RIFCSPHIGHO2_02_FULL_40_12b]|nr:MAG: hypothetical protein A3J63_00445 [Candidatus Moranbacteria bacterium RIFCSPHIGHO2_02_FULL_40_12b]